MTVPLILPLLLIAFLVAEAIVVRLYRDRIPLRIHVSGTRGKSSVVRYIVAGLRAGGMRPLGKVTGVVPELLLPDGSLQRIRRRGAARVHEQVRTLVRAGRIECDAVVLECMSVDPTLQRFEADVLRPTVSVLTNVREDHAEVYGGLTPLEGPAAAAVAGTGVLVLPGGVLEDLDTGISSAAGRRIVRTENGDNADSPIPDFRRGNIALALQACIEAGVDPRIALEAITKEAAASVPQSYPWESGGVRRVFIDGFSVNDAQSAELFLGSCRASGSVTGNLFLILNTRADRPLRTRQFTQWVATRRDLSGVIVTGSHSGYCGRALVHAGVDPSILHQWSDDDVRHAPERCSVLTRGAATFVGLMNIGGDGFRIIDAFQGATHGH